MPTTYCLETVFEVWNNDTGERIEVGEDRDGLDMTEIRFRGDNSEILSRITMCDEQVPLVIEALQKAYELKMMRKAQGGPKK